MKEISDQTPEMIVEMLRVAFKDGVQAGFDWPKLALAEVHKEQLYEKWAAKNAENYVKGERKPASPAHNTEFVPTDDWECGCPEGAEADCVYVVCPRK